TKARTGPHMWRLVWRAKPTDERVVVDVRCDPGGGDISLRIPLVRVPRADHEPFYRVLLTLNDQTTEEARVGVSDDVAFLSFTEPAALVEQRDPERLISELVSMAEHLRARLSSVYGTEPVRDAP